jgi:hypothetical protein
MFLQPYYRSLHDFYDYPPAGTAFRRSSPANGRLLGATRGRIYTEITSASSLDLFPGITARLVLDNCFKRLLVVMEIDRIETLRAEGVYIAFPFAAARPTVRVSCHGGWFRPEHEQIPGSSKDWYCVQKWIDVEADGRHITWSPLEAPLVQLGSLTMGRWLDQIAIDNGTVFSFIMNNYWWTNSPASQGGRFRFRYALTSAGGGFDAAAAARFGHDFHLPLSAEVFEPTRSRAGRPAGSFLERELPGNVMLIGAKEGENGSGIVLRFMETAGMEARFTVALSGARIRRAALLSPVEDSLRPLRAGTSGVAVAMAPFELQTVRLET